MSALKIMRYFFAMILVSVSLQASCGSDCPDCDWFKLLRDNKRFIHNPKYAKQRARLVDGQNPPYVILSCSDSRVPPELIFDQGLGQLFSVRVAGNVTDAIVVDSIEFAVKTWDVTTLVVMGHTRCGAVEGALARLRRNHGKIDHIKGDHFLAVLIPIEKAIVAAGIDIYAPDALPQATRANISYQAKELLRRSPIITRAVEKGQIIIVGSEYILATGRVEQLFIIDSCNVHSVWDEFWLQSSSSSSSSSWSSDSSSSS